MTKDEITEFYWGLMIGYLKVRKDMSITEFIELMVRYAPRG